MIRLRLLGSVDLIDDDEQPIDAALRRSKVIAVLAYLAAARPRGFHRRDKVVALFWPELPTERARAALRITLTRIRDALGGDVLITRGADEIAIDASRLWCDVSAIDDAVRAGHLHDAVALYRGAFLDGIHIEGTAEELEHWIETERSRIRSELVRALAASSDLWLAEQAVRIVPTDDAASRRLIELLLARGDAAGALQAYDSLARVLHRELGVSPAAQTASLVSRLREPSTPAVASTSATRIAFAAPPVPPARRRWTGALSFAVGTAVVTVAAAAVVHSRTSAEAAQPPRTARSVRYSGAHVIRGRIASEALLDSTGDAVLVIGGLVYGEDPAHHSEILNDVWRLRGLRDTEFPEWLPQPADGDAPDPRWLFGLAYDSAHDRAILHGGARGYTSPCANDTWILRDASGRAAKPAWSRVRIDGPMPTARGGIRVFYDASTRRLIRFGGHDCFHEYVNEVWVLSFDDASLRSGRWARLSPDAANGAPAGRAGFAAAYDARTNRLIVHAGNAGGRTAGDVWILDHANGDAPSAWHRMDCAGTTPILSSHNAAFDSTTGAMVVFGGTDDTDVPRRELWRVSGLTETPARCSWTQVPIAEPGPNARLNHSMLVNPRTHDLLIVGGESASSAMRDVVVVPNPFRDTGR